MAKLAKINLHQPKASREQYIQSPLFQYSWTCGGKILFVWHGMCFCTKAILAWCFEKLSQAHHCLILGNWARLNFLRSHARLTLVTPSPYHTADNSAVTSSIIRAPGVTEKTTATSKRKRDGKEAPAPAFSLFSLFSSPMLNFSAVN